MDNGTQPDSEVQVSVGSDDATLPAAGGPPMVHPYRTAIAGLSSGDWTRMLLWTVVAGVSIAVPARLVPNALFSRMTPTRTEDYVFWILGAVLTGAVLGLRRVGGNRDTKALGGGLATFVAVGCPVCNKLVVALIGVGGATTVFAPMQPVIGMAALAMLVWALRTQLRSLVTPACTVAR